VNEAASSVEVAVTRDEDTTKTKSRRRWFSPVLALPTPVIFVAAAVLATGLLWRGGGLAGIIESLKDTPPIKLVGLLLVYAASILLLGIRWHTLVRMAGGSPEWTSSAEVFLTSVIVNYAAPIGLAVPTRAALTVRDLDMNPGQSGAVVGWEAALDALALVFISVAWLALGGSALLLSMPVNRGALTVVATLLVLGVVAVGLVARSDAVHSRVAPFARRMVSSPADHPLLALLALGLTAGFWLIQIGVMAAILDVFGVAFSPSILLGIMGLPMLIGMLSPVPGGAGVREALMAAAARLEGVPTAPVVLAAVAYRLALFVVTPLVWVVIRLASTGVKRR
jgi:uncharacterized membrane protein YbhN (UPF0104 family)